MKCKVETCPLTSLPDRAFCEAHVEVPGPLKGIQRSKGCTIAECSEIGEHSHVASARVCTKHGTPEYCPDGVCRWCVPAATKAPASKGILSGVRWTLEGSALPPLEKPHLSMLDLLGPDLPLPPIPIRVTPAQMKDLKISFEVNPQLLEGLFQPHDPATCSWCKTFRAAGP